jgi:TolB-like protein/cytochrome c-type biogenesis protein CcmH/NrfG
MKIDNFFAELKRRNVYKVAVAYAVVSWLLIQVATQVFPFFEIPNWAVRLVVVLLILGFPVALILSWAFEITPEGIKRESEIEPNKSISHRTGRKLVAITAVLSVIAAGLFVFQFIRPKGATNSASKAEALPNIPEKSIAVLPFENLSDEKQNAYFADGVQDEILTHLAKIADLKVISRTSVMQYRDAAKRNLRDIAQQLGVAHILEGTVQRASDKVRVNTQLINARTDAHEWAENYDRPLTDVFAIQSEIAKTIAGQLQAHLSPSEKVAIAQAPTTDVVANDLYIRARAFSAMANDPGAKGYLLQGISLLEEALRRDPNFLQAQCLLVQIHTDLYWFGFDHTPARLDASYKALQQAERIRPDAAEVHLEKGGYLYHGFRKYAEALAEFEIARQSLPNSSELYLRLGSIDRRQSRWDEARKNFARGVELDPRNTFVLVEAGFTSMGLGYFAEGKELFERAIKVAPRDYTARITLAFIDYYSRADLEPMRAQLDAFEKEGPEATANAAELFLTYALVKRDSAAAARALTFIPAEGSISPVGNFLMPREWFVGLVARTFGDTKEAERAFTAARQVAAKTVQEQPDYAPAWSMLGMIDSGLGRKADAMAEGKRACELLPLSKDSWEGPFYVDNLALIYVWVGEKDLALEELAHSSKTNVGINYGELKLDPTWDPLRQDPRFQELLNWAAAKVKKAAL